VYIQDIKTLKNVTRVAIADQQKAGKQGRDDSMKLLSIQLYPACSIYVIFLAAGACLS